MADRIVVMNHGVIEQVGTPTEIYRHPKTLFVADFIGEANKLDARAEDADGVSFGKTELRSVPHGFSKGEAVIAAIRPEDVTPHAPGSRPEGAGNLIDVTIGEMEFLGSFWRTRLRGEELGEEVLIADFSVNAARRL